MVVFIWSHLKNAFLLCNVQQIKFSLSCGNSYIFERFQTQKYLECFNFREIIYFCFPENSL